MKVLFIDVNYKKGSTGKIVADTCSYLHSKKIETFACYGRGPKIDEKNVFKFGIDLETYFHAFMTRLTGYTGVFSYFSTRRLIKCIDTFKPDIIHIHELHGYFINYKPLFEYIKKHNIKCVWTQHCCWSFTGHCAHFDYVGCDKWLTGCYNCPNKKEYPSSLIFDRSKNQYKQKKEVFTSLQKDNMLIVSPSKWLDNLVGKSFLNCYEHIVINNGINLDNFCYTDNHTFDNIINRDKKIVLAVAGDWTEKKGYNDIIKISNMLKDDYQVVMVGLTKKQIESLSNTNIVAIERTNNQKELAELYSISKCFINPTYEDTFPTVNIEAQACGTPVITYNTGGSPETITKESGIVVEKGNIEAMKCAIESIGDSISKENISNYAKDNFSCSKMTKQYLECYLKSKEQ